MTTPDTTTAAIAALLDGVTPGPWRKSYGFSTQVASASSVVCNAMLHENARFIAASRELVPALAAERDRLASMLNFTTDRCDHGHVFIKLGDHPLRDGSARCPYCMAIGLDAALDESDRLAAEVEDLRLAAEFEALTAELARGRES